MRVIRLFWALACVLFLPGCVTDQSVDYPLVTPYNLTINPKQVEPGFLASRNINIAVYHEKSGSDCEFEYAGSIILSEDQRQVGIPTGRPLLIQFNFSTNDYLSSANSLQSYDTVFVPIADKMYVLSMRYDSTGVNYEFNEEGPGGLEKIETLDRSSCRPFADN